MMAMHNAPNKPRLAAAIRISSAASSAQHMTVKGLGTRYTIEQRKGGAEGEKEQHQALQSTRQKDRLFRLHVVSPVSVHTTQVGT